MKAEEAIRFKEYLGSALSEEDCLPASGESTAKKRRAKNKTMLRDARQRKERIIAEHLVKHSISPLSCGYVVSCMYAIVFEATKDYVSEEKAKSLFENARSSLYTVTRFEKDHECSFLVSQLHEAMALFYKQTGRFQKARTIFRTGRFLTGRSDIGGDLWWMYFEATSHLAQGHTMHSLRILDEIIEICLRDPSRAFSKNLPFVLVSKIRNLRLMGRIEEAERAAVAWEGHISKSSEALTELNWEIALTYATGARTFDHGYISELVKTGHSYFSKIDFLLEAWIYEKASSPDFYIMLEKWVDNLDRTGPKRKIVKSNMWSLDTIKRGCLESGAVHEVVKIARCFEDLTFVVRGSNKLRFESYISEMTKRLGRVQDVEKNMILNVMIARILISKGAGTFAPAFIGQYKALSLMTTGGTSSDVLNICKDLYNEDNYGNESDAADEKDSGNSEGFSGAGNPGKHSVAGADPSGNHGHGS